MAVFDFEAFYQKDDPWNVRKKTPQSKRRVSVLESLAPILRDKRILEVGCGEGTQTKIFARYGHIVVGFDISETAIQRARNLNLKDVDFRIASMTEFRDYAKFNVIILLECLYYLSAADQSSVLTAIKNSGHGSLVISAPIIGENQFQKYYTETELRTLLQVHGFEVDMARVVGLNYPPTKIERIMTLIFKGAYLSPIGGALDYLWDKVPERWVYQKLFVCRY
jgi:2-polyprenyl-3-methyl-5-hydroxy-6-metoxy-1,4-benzoquinol methylase